MSADFGIANVDQSSASVLLGNRRDEVRVVSVNSRRASLTRMSCLFAGGFLLLGAAACQPGSTGDPDSGPSGALTIQTDRLATGTAGARYSQRISATGGSPPYSWAISKKAASFDWLSMDATSGVLSGTPNSKAEGSITVAVKDSATGFVEKPFTLKAEGCTSASACVGSDGGACYTGTQLCNAGVLAPCSLSAIGSTDAGECGPDCGQCDETANACRAGQCVCGDGGSCAAGSQACCDGGCSNLDDAKSCGICGNDCTKRLSDGGHTQAKCESRLCEAVCDQGYTFCSGTKAADAGEAGIQCTDLSTDLRNCGRCGNACLPANRATYGCGNGSCFLATCDPRFLDCDRSPGNGCEVEVGANNCGGCGVPCIPGSNARGSCDSSPLGKCNLACNSGFSSCNGKTDPTVGLASGENCSVQLATDPNNCGECGRRCGNGQVCAGGECGCATSCNGNGTACRGGSGRQVNNIIIGASCVCDTTTGCSGCCWGASCQSGDSASACGAGGRACVACGAGCDKCTVTINPKGYPLVKCGSANEPQVCSGGRTCVCERPTGD